MSMTCFKSSVLMVGAIVLISVPGASALAQGWGGGSGNPLGSLGRYDADKDGKISFSEYETAQLDQFKAMDSNGDNIVTADELTAYAKARAAEMAQRMGGADSDRINMMVQHRIDTVKKADTNGDGSISLDEFKAFYTAQFKQLDTNNDGFLSAGEIRAGMGNMGHH